MWEDLFLFAAVGFAAQVVDGALSMAYGVTATSVLLGFGVPPAMASASVHAAEVFTTAASGIAHWRQGNICVSLLRRLVLPGVVGGILGAVVLVGLPSEIVRPIVSVYLMVMGTLILWRALRRTTPRADAPRHLTALGLAGGFLDAIGGGGWGATVTARLLGLELWPMIAGLVLGGVLAAPFAAYLTRHVPDQPLMILVGAVIVLLSLRGLVQTLT